MIEAMTEADWLACADPDLLLEFVVDKISRRQLIEFVRGCWQHIEPFLPAVESPATVPDQFALLAERQTQMDAGRYATEAALKAAGWAPPPIEKERQQQAELLRHIVGNPFRPRTSPGHFSPATLDLARSLAGGADCSFALHDALLEDGDSVLAAHFRQHRNHPQGCWALEAILEAGKGG